MFTNSKTIIQGEEENRSEWYAKNIYQIGIYSKQLLNAMQVYY